MMDGWMDGRMDGQMDGWMDGWMDGRTDGRMMSDIHSRHLYTDDNKFPVQVS